MVFTFFVFLYRRCSFLLSAIPTKLPFNLCILLLYLSHQNVFNLIVVLFLFVAKTIVIYSILSAN